MPCYITRTASFLPGPPVENADIHRFLGVLDGEEETRDKVLTMNGIVRRHYAQDEQQMSTDDIYGLAATAARACLLDSPNDRDISYIAAGTTYSPLAAPGFASITHDRLSDLAELNRPVEISSHAGICSSSANALVSAIRAVSQGDHRSAVSIGADHPSEILKSQVIRPVDDRSEHENLRHSRWFMSVFLRFMLSDGAGCFLLQDQPDHDNLSLRVNWTHSTSFAHAAPICMKLENREARLSQDLSVLSRHLVPCATEFLKLALAANDDTLDSHRMILPHMSSFFFRRKLERVIANHSADPNSPTPYWTNLATAGNTGAASIYVMLDHYLRRDELRDGDRILLFVPESGQFNFVLVSLTAVKP